MQKAVYAQSIPPGVGACHSGGRLLLSSAMLLLC